jgi:putative addiction module component (TIGR02574 family)
MSSDPLADLLRLPVEERAKAARVLLDSLDEAGDDPGFAEAQAAELLRRLEVLDAGQAQLIDAAEAHARIAARLKTLRAR